MVVEAFSREQLKYNTGGPPDEERLVSCASRKRKQMWIDGLKTGWKLKFIIIIVIIITIICYCYCYLFYFLIRYFYHLLTYQEAGYDQG